MAALCDAEGDQNGQKSIQNPKMNRQAAPPDQPAHAIKSVQDAEGEKQTDDKNQSLPGIKLCEKLHEFGPPTLKTPTDRQF